MQSLLAPRPLPWRRFLIGSLVGHALLVALALLWAWVGLGPRVKLDPEPIKATLVRQGKARDKNLLPRKEEPVPPPKAVEAPPQPTPEPSPTPPAPSAPAVAIPNAAPKPPPAAQKGDRSGEDRRKKLFGAFDKAAKPSSSDEEPEGAEDGDPNGDSATAEGERYFALLKSQIERNYNVANVIPESERIQLKARVLVKVSRAGDVVDVRLTKPSGNGVFDAAVVNAVRRAAPFSPPPDHLRSQLRDGVALEFAP